MACLPGGHFARLADLHDVHRQLPFSGALPSLCYVDVIVLLHAPLLLNYSSPSNRDLVAIELGVTDDNATTVCIRRQELSASTR
jgi:hypothetical protein